jgi:hypothetical protein
MYLSPRSAFKVGTYRVPGTVSDRRTVSEERTILYAAFTVVYLFTVGPKPVNGVSLGEGSRLLFDRKTGCPASARAGQTQPCVVKKARIISRSSQKDAYLSRRHWRSVRKHDPGDPLLHPYCIVNLQLQRAVTFVSRNPRACICSRQQAEPEGPWGVQ